MENPPQAKFCVECGAPVARRCLACGTENPPWAKFCMECARPVSSAGVAAGPSAPRRGSTARHLGAKILVSLSAFRCPRSELLALAVVMLVAVFLRTYRLTDLPSLGLRQLPGTPAPPLHSQPGHPLQQEGPQPAVHGRRAHPDPLSDHRDRLVTRDPEQRRHPLDHADITGLERPTQRLLQLLAGLRRDPYADRGHRWLLVWFDILQSANDVH